MTADEVYFQIVIKICMILWIIFDESSDFRKSI